MLNEGIRVAQVRLIVPSGEQLLISTQEALRKAKEEGLDLLIVSPESSPPVAKILNYGQYKYQKDKKQKETKKKSNQKASVQKELKLTPRIGVHDFDVRVRQCRDFLTKGYKVKLVIFFKGREASHAELGHVMIEKFLNKIEDLGWAESPEIKPTVVGRTMAINIIAGKKKPVLETPQVENKPGQTEIKVETKQEL